MQLLSGYPRWEAKGMEGKLVAERYRMLRRIGQGTMGEVWLAEDERTKREVAVKLLNAAEQSAAARERFFREGTLCAQVSSSHVVEVFDQGTTNENIPFMAMEYLVGQTLRERLTEEGSLSVSEVGRIVKGLSLAVESAHEAGIVHRDLKPENVFLVGDGDDEQVKLLDFGVAKATDFMEASAAATATGDLLGTPCYMSPEQAQGLRSVDHRSDLWAIGTIVFECLTGVRPFDGKNLSAIVARILSGPIPVPSQVAADSFVTPEIDAWMVRALARDPAQRFTSARELREAFTEAARTRAAMPVSGDESAIRVALQAGDTAGAANAAVSRFGPEVLRYLSGHLGDPDLADDAFSEFLQRVWSSLPRFEWRSSFRTWAFVIARRAAADVKRAERRERARRQPLGDSQLSEVAAQVRTATLPLLRTEAKTALARLREELPHEDKMLLILRGDRGLAWEAVACVSLDNATPGELELKRESARLRKRYQLVKARLRERAKATGLLDA